MSTLPHGQVRKNTGATPMHEKSLAPYIGDMSKKEEIYTTKEIAELFKVSVYAVRVWAARGLPGAVKIGKSWRFTTETVDYLKFSGVV